MFKYSKGNSEKLGKRIKQKAGLNKAILDQEWCEFCRQLEYTLALGWRAVYCGACVSHQPDLPLLRQCCQRESAQAGQVCVC